jgi:hypothetical protein
MGIIGDAKTVGEISQMLAWWRALPGNGNAKTQDQSSANYAGSVTADVGGRTLPRLFRVFVTQNGGSAGNSTTQCTFTYDVFDDVGKTHKIAGTLALEKARLLNCAMTAGTVGIAYVERGVVKLWDVNERAQQTNCT